MTDTTYIPSSGLVGKWRRLSARLFECEPLKFETDRLVVSFTFDDFPKSAVEHGATELDRRGWRGTWYAASDFAGGNNHHGQLFEPSDITRLTEAGHEIACHTRSHLDVAASKVDTVEQEIAENRAALAAMGYAGDLPAFAYPYGETAPRAKRALSRQFETLRGVQPGINRSGADRLLLKAVGLDGGEDGIARALSYIKDGQRDPGWLIFYAHDIQAEPTDWGCTPEQFTRVCDAVSASGARVLTVTNAYRALLDA